MSTRADMFKRYAAIASASVKAPEPPKKHQFEILNEQRQAKREAEVIAQQEEVARQIAYMTFFAKNKRYLHAYQTKVKSCEERGLEWRITFHQFVELMQVEKCAYTGTVFPKDSGRSIERVNPKVGYTMENVVIVTSQANSQKSQLDQFVHENHIPNEMKIKLLRKAMYQLEKNK
ncbi:hypothetical protein OFDDKENP_00256 [Aeromonas phage B614]|nr:hypothetical protein OFDDKENP_00256 [Aeromonas phage B614]UYD58267.1 hypothetical protein JNEOFJEA_00188 [Aeromonas phage UP87]UYD58381.1 hypothetical protein IPAKJDPM_00038 [Aeromonas phage avDM14-QBC]UYD58597.1 hypothetical protein HNNIDBEH_00004 [Aeromonas phage avDM10-HWA]UYD59100.1 hypothetical protein OFOPOMKI_00250 [Aeromonas phage avDM7-IJDJ]UYD59912.1 hypothetical protein LEHPIFIF_00139 [Aeromonas phage avDM9-HANS]